MRAKALQILWHGDDVKDCKPVLGVDVSVEDNLVATAGADNEIKVSHHEMFARGADDDRTGDTPHTWDAPIYSTARRPESDERNVFLT